MVRKRRGIIKIVCSALVKHERSSNRERGREVERGRRRSLGQGNKQRGRSARDLLEQDMNDMYIEYNKWTNDSKRRKKGIHTHSWIMRLNESSTEQNRARATALQGTLSDYWLLITTRGDLFTQSQHRSVYLPQGNNCAISLDVPVGVPVLPARVTRPFSTGS